MTFPEAIERIQRQNSARTLSHDEAAAKSRLARVCRDILVYGDLWGADLPIKVRHVLHHCRRLRSIRVLRIPDHPWTVPKP